MRNGATYDATTKSLEFPLNPATSSNSGNRDSIETGPILDGTQLVKGYSVSTWFRADSQAAWEQIWVLGKVGLGKHEGLWLSGSATISIHTDAGGGQNYYYPCASGGVWKHVTFVRKGTTSSDHDVYVDGVKVSPSSTANGSAVQAFEKDSNLILGENINHTHYGFDGAISNFKLYDTALTAEEVKTLYDMGRCDEGHHVVNFSKTRVGIGLGDGEAPRAALDVRGPIYVDNGLVPGRFVGFAVNDTSATSNDVIEWNRQFGYGSNSIEFADFGNNDDSGIVKIPYTGAWQFNWSFIQLSGNTNLNVQVSTDGGANFTTTQFRSHGTDGGSGLWTNVSGSFMIRLQKGNQLRLFNLGNNYGASTPHNHFSGIFIGG